MADTYSVEGPVIWNQVGDFPGVSGFKGDRVVQICPICKQPFTKHGTLKNPHVYKNAELNKSPQMELTVCPGDYMFTMVNKTEDKSTFRMRPEEFLKNSGNSSGGASVGGMEILKRIELLEAIAKDHEARLLKLGG